MDIQGHRYQFPRMPVHGKFKGIFVLAAVETWLRLKTGSRLLNVSISQVVPLISVPFLIVIEDLACSALYSQSGAGAWSN